MDTGNYGWTYTRDSAGCDAVHVKEEVDHRPLSPIVYTTRLEQLDIFRNNTKHKKAKKIYEIVAQQSKPVFNPLKRNTLGCLGITHQRLKEKIHIINSEVHSGKSTKFRRYESNSEKQMYADEDCTGSDRSASDSSLQEIKLSDTPIKPQHPISNPNGIIIYDHQQNEAEKYSFDKNYRVTDYKKVDDNITAAFNDSPFHRVYCCCWFERERFLNVSFPQETAKGLRKPHNCRPGHCLCCCKINETVSTPQPINDLEKTSPSTWFKNLTNNVPLSCFVSDTDQAQNKSTASNNLLVKCLTVPPSAPKTRSNQPKENAIFTNPTNLQFPGEYYQIGLNDNKDIQAAKMDLHNGPNASHNDQLRSVQTRHKDSKNKNHKRKDRKSKSKNKASSKSKKSKTPTIHKTPLNKTDELFDVPSSAVLSNYTFVPSQNGGNTVKLRRMSTTSPPSTPAASSSRVKNNEVLSEAQPNPKKAEKEDSYNMNANTLNDPTTSDVTQGFKIPKKRTRSKSFAKESSAIKKRRKSCPSLDECYGDCPNASSSARKYKEYNQNSSNISREKQGNNKKQQLHETAIDHRPRTRQRTKSCCIPETNKDLLATNPKKIPSSPKSLVDSLYFSSHGDANCSIQQQSKPRRNNVSVDKSHNSNETINEATKPFQSKIIHRDQTNSLPSSSVLHNVVSNHKKRPNTRKVVNHEEVPKSALLGVNNCTYVDENAINDATMHHNSTLKKEDIKISTKGLKNKPCITHHRNSRYIKKSSYKNLRKQRLSNNKSLIRTRRRSNSTDYKKIGKLIYDKRANIIKLSGDVLLFKLEDGAKNLGIKSIKKNMSLFLLCVDDSFAKTNDIQSIDEILEEPSRNTDKIQDLNEDDNAIDRTEDAPQDSSNAVGSNTLEKHSPSKNILRNSISEGSHPSKPIKSEIITNDSNSNSNVKKNTLIHSFLLGDSIDDTDSLQNISHEISSAGLSQTPPIGPSHGDSNHNLNDESTSAHNQKSNPSTNRNPCENNKELAMKSEVKNTTNIETQNELRLNTDKIQDLNEDDNVIDLTEDAPQDSSNTICSNKLRNSISEESHPPTPIKNENTTNDSNNNSSVRSITSIHSFLLGDSIDDTDSLQNISHEISSAGLSQTPPIGPSHGDSNHNLNDVSTSAHNQNSNPSTNRNPCENNKELAMKSEVKNTTNIETQNELRLNTDKIQDLNEDDNVIDLTEDAPQDSSNTICSNKLRNSISEESHPPMPIKNENTTNDSNNNSSVRSITSIHSFLLGDSIDDTDSLQNISHEISSAGLSQTPPIGPSHGDCNHNLNDELIAANHQKSNPSTNRNPCENNKELAMKSEDTTNIETQNELTLNTDKIQYLNEGDNVIDLTEDAPQDSSNTICSNTLRNSISEESHPPMPIKNENTTNDSNNNSSVRSITSIHSFLLGDSIDDTDSLQNISHEISSAGLSQTPPIGPSHGDSNHNLNDVSTSAHNQKSNPSTNRNPCENNKELAMKIEDTTDIETDVPPKNGYHRTPDVRLTDKQKPPDITLNDDITTENNTSHASTMQDLYDDIVAVVNKAAHTVGEHKVQYLLHLIEFSFFIADDNAGTATSEQNDNQKPDSVANDATVSNKQKPKKPAKYRSVMMSRLIDKLKEFEADDDNINIKIKHESSTNAPDETLSSSGSENGTNVKGLTAGASESSTSHLVSKNGTNNRTLNGNVKGNINTLKEDSQQTASKNSLKQDEAVNIMIQNCIDCNISDERVERLKILRNVLQIEDETDIVIID
ncbi:uncharacterized protein DDB_G0283357-like isoform X2 [Trichoplusia ni]|uniref:Uncharacterized protein DDB_G0283357-like isoform X2 n=1 Tax=Trichoplusia ni TaxID=7111 RepID=A0A7E5VIZ7_TRINI|nr:uncharacterized protein DDB_G0283357-like isoform X2 [Trichoplusia ni]